MVDLKIYLVSTTHDDGTVELNTKIYTQRNIKHALKYKDDSTTIYEIDTGDLHTGAGANLTVEKIEKVFGKGITPKQFLNPPPKHVQKWKKEMEKSNG